MVLLAVRVLRPLVVLVLAAALLMSGCVAKKDDAQLLREGARSSMDSTGDLFSISVPKGAEVLRITIDTRADDDGSVPGCGSWCDEWMTAGGDDGDEQRGHVRVLADPPSGDDEVFLNVGHDKVDTTAIDDPEPGMWEVIVSYEDDYNGPMFLRAESTGRAAGGGDGVFVFGGSFWDIAGLVVSLGLLVGGAWLYRRRGNFLRRELHKIDNTVHLFKDDVDECRTNLLELQDHLKELLVRRKIEDSHYLILEKRIERYLSDLETPGNRHAARAEAAAASPPPPGPARRKPTIVEEPTEWEPL